MTEDDQFGWTAMLSVLRLAQRQFSDHLILMPANAETQFTLFDRPSSLDGHRAHRQKRRVQLPNLVQDVGQLENDELIDLIRIAIGEARRREIGLVAEMDNRGQETTPLVQQTRPAVPRIIRQAAPMPNIPPAKASMVRAAVRAGFSHARVAKDFGVSVAMVRKLAAT
jgi:hypothetical protein